MTDDRLARLRQMMAAPGPRAVEGLVAALLDPVLELLDTPRHCWYVRLVFRQLAEGSTDVLPDPAGAADDAEEASALGHPSGQMIQREVMGAMFNPVAREFISAPLRVRVS